MAWKTFTLSELCDIAIGRTPSRDRPDYWDQSRATGNRWVSIADMGAGNGIEISETKEQLSHAGAAITPLVRAGTLMLSFKLSIGKLAFAGCDLRTNEAIAALSPRNPNQLSRQFLYWYLRSVDWHDASKGNEKVMGATLNKAKLAALSIPVPPLPEQQHIAAILDDAFAAIAKATANAEQNIANAGNLFLGYLNSTFADLAAHTPAMPLSRIGITQTGSTPRTALPGLKGCAIPFIKPGDFRPNGTLDYENEGLSEQGRAAARIVPAGSALMVCIGATIGKAGYADRDITTNQQINSVSPRPGVSGRFLYHQMRTFRFQMAVIEGAGQATLPIINKTKWSALPVLVPTSLEEQEAIADRLDELRAATDQLAAKQRTKLAALAELRTSLLYRAFTGQLTNASAVAA